MDITSAISICLLEAIETQPICSQELRKLFPQRLQTS
jgi:hypothetical protein